MARDKYTIYNDQNYDHTLEDWGAATGWIPLVGDFINIASGNEAKKREEAARLANQQKALDELSAGHEELDELSGYTPTVDEMTARYTAARETEDYGGLLNSDAALARADQRSIDAQNKALSELENIYSQGGNDAMFRAGIGQALGRAAQQERGSRDAYAQEARARGMAGGGLEALGALTANQSAAQLANQNSLNVAAAAQQRALAALEGAGNLGGDIRNASFQEAFNRGQARDASVARYNAARQAAAARNADRAQQQRRDTGTSRSQAYRDQYGYRQGQYDRRQEIRDRAAGIYTGNAQQSQQRATAAQARADSASQRVYDIATSAAEKAIGAA